MKDGSTDWRNTNHDVSNLYATRKLTIHENLACVGISRLPTQTADEAMRMESQSRKWMTHYSLRLASDQDPYGLIDSRIYPHHLGCAPTPHHQCSSATTPCSKQSATTHFTSTRPSIETKLHPQLLCIMYSSMYARIVNQEQQALNSSAVPSSCAPQMREVGA